MRPPNPFMKQQVNSHNVVTQKSKISPLKIFLSFYEKNPDYFYINNLEKSIPLAQWLGPFLSSKHIRELRPYEESYLLNKLAIITKIHPSQILDEWKENEKL
jgi:hypothetical protein